MKQIVVFDVDNTIVDGLSQSLFVDYLYNKGMVSIIYRIRLLLWIILYKIGLIKNPKPAMEYGLSFIKGKPIYDIEKIVENFFNELWAKNIFPEAVKIINDHKKSGREVILVSNAPDILIKKLSEYLGLENYISTRLENIDGVYTGKIIGEIMYGEQKLNSVNSYISSNNLSLENSWAYGDHETDAFLLQKVTHPFAVNPTKLLKKIALKNNWPILTFKI